MKALKFLVFILIVPLVFSCRVDPSPLTEELDESETKIELVCEPIQSQGATQRNAVYVIIEENKVKIAELTNCNTVSPNQYENYQIPSEALAVVGGDAETIFATKEDNKIIFLAGKKDLIQNDKVEYYPLVTYENGKYFFKIPLNEEDLVGTYAAEGEEKSWVLFLGMRENGLVGQFFEINGPLPDKKVMARILPVMPVMDLNNLKIDLKDQHIKSELGPGYFYSSNDQLEIVFTEFENDPSGRLTMKPLQ